MIMLNTLVVVREDLDDAARFDASTSAAVDHALELKLESGEAGEPTLDVT